MITTECRHFNCNVIQDNPEMLHNFEVFKLDKSKLRARKFYVDYELSIQR